MNTKLQSKEREKCQKGLQPKGVARRNKMLLAAVQLFLENGYEKTTTAAIAKGSRNGTIIVFAAFENKEALLLTLVQQMFNRQFENAEQLLGGAERSADAVWNRDCVADVYYRVVGTVTGIICDGVLTADNL